MQLGIGKESDFQILLFLWLLLPSLSPTFCFRSPIRKGKFSGYFPSVKSSQHQEAALIATHGRRAFFSIGKTGKRVFAPYKDEDEGIKMLLSQQSSLPSHYFAAKSPREDETKKMVFVFLSLHSASNPNLHSPLHRSLCRYWHEVCIMCKNFLEER